MDTGAPPSLLPSHTRSWAADDTALWRTEEQTSVNLSDIMNNNIMLTDTTQVLIINIMTCTFKYMKYNK